MIKKLYIKIGFITTIVLVILVFILFGLSYQENKNYEKRGKILIDKIETYRKIENKLPNDVQDLGINEPMNDGPYYEKKDSINYIVYFNIGFDNMKVYYSNTKRWKDEP